MEKEATPTHHQKPSRHLATKKNGFLHLLRVVLYMIRRRSAKKTNAADVASKGLWKRMVGSMRPLHHQQLQQNSSPERPQQLNYIPPSPSVNSFHDVPPSPASSSCSDGTKSRYASATDLQALDKPDYGEIIEVVIEEGSYYDDEGDEMIDSKAEEFIANFYEQMKLQRLQSIRYSERIRV